MIPENREALHVLSGEYVLGVLGPEMAREVESALASHAELRRAVIFWEERFHGLSATVPPAEPPADAWDRIAERLGPATALPATMRRRDPVRTWRWLTAASVATAAALALYIALAPPAAGPSLVAVLHAPQQGQPAWVATAGGNKLLIHAVGASAAAPGDRSFELWAIALATSRPQPLGVIPADGRLELDALPPVIRDGITLAISIEPKGGSPTGQPTGPVVFVGPLIAAK